MADRDADKDGLMRWQIAPFVHLHSCGDQWAAFHSGNGDTLLLNAAAGDLLALLRDHGPQKTSALLTLAGWDPADVGILSEWLADLQHGRLIREHRV